MDERARLLEKLVLERHVNVAERRFLGIVAQNEVADILKSLLFRYGIYPPRHEESAVYEGATIRTKPSGFQITWERAYAWNPNRVAEQRVEVFTDIDVALEAFMESEWKAGIDGILITTQN